MMSQAEDNEQETPIEPVNSGKSALSAADVYELLNEDKVPENTYLTVGNARVEKEGLGQHISYLVRFSQGPRYIVARRRYKDFEWLYTRLSYECPGCIIPPIPEKQLLPSYTMHVVEARRRLLERFLDRVIQHDTLRSSKALFDFIMLTEQIQHDIVMPKRPMEEPAGSGSGDAKSTDKNGDETGRSAASGTFTIGEEEEEGEEGGEKAERAEGKGMFSFAGGFLRNATDRLSIFGKRVTQQVSQQLKLSQPSSEVRGEKGEHERFAEATHELLQETETALLDMHRQAEKLVRVHRDAADAMSDISQAAANVANAQSRSTRLVPVDADRSLVPTSHVFLSRMSATCSDISIRQSTETDQVLMNLQEPLKEWIRYVSSAKCSLSRQLTAIQELNTGEEMLRAKQRRMQQLLSGAKPGTAAALIGQQSESEVHEWEVRVERQRAYVMTTHVQLLEEVARFREQLAADLANIVSDFATMQRELSGKLRDLWASSGVLLKEPLQAQGQTPIAYLHVPDSPRRSPAGSSQPGSPSLSAVSPPVSSFAASSPPRLQPVNPPPQPSAPAPVGLPVTRPAAPAVGSVSQAVAPAVHVTPPAVPPLNIPTSAPAQPQYRPPSPAQAPKAAAPQTPAPQAAPQTLHRPPSPLPVATAPAATAPPSASSPANAAPSAVRSPQTVPVQTPAPKQAPAPSPFAPSPTHAAPPQQAPVPRPAAQQPQSAEANPFGAPSPAAARPSAAAAAPGGGSPFGAAAPAHTAAPGRSPFESSPPTAPTANPAKSPFEESPPSGPLPAPALPASSPFEASPLTSAPAHRAAAASSPFGQHSPFGAEEEDLPPADADANPFGSSNAPAAPAVHRSVGGAQGELKLPGEEGEDDDLFSKLPTAPPEDESPPALVEAPAHAVASPFADAHVHEANPFGTADGGVPDF